MHSKLTKRTRIFAVNAFRYLILGGLSFLILYPLIITILISVMRSSDAYDASVRFFSTDPTLENYKNSIIFLDYGATSLKSLLFNILLSGVEVICCLFVAYGFARFDFPFKNLFFGFSMITLLVPYHIYFTPLYISFRNYGPLGWNLLKTPLPMFLLSATGIALKDGLIIYIMRQSFKAYPKEIEEAATVDGAGVMKVFTRIMLPGSLAVSMTCFMFSFVWKWTDPTFTDVFFPNTEFMWTMMANIEAKFNLLPEYGDVYYRALLKNSSAVLFMIPLLILFLICKRFLVESIETTGLVG